MCQALQEALAALLTLPNSEVYCYLPDRELRPGSLTNAIQNSHSSNSDPNLNILHPIRLCYLPNQKKAVLNKRI